MFPSKVKAKLARREPVLVFLSHLTDRAVQELVGLMGFDCVWLDLEHHIYSLETAQEMMRAARIGSGADVMARPGRGEYQRLMRMLEAGAHGILYPRCASAEEAREVVRAMKFHPQGYRGMDGGNRDMPFCTMPTDKYIRFANAQTFLFCQIETPADLEHVEEIMAVESMDGIFFGPNDFSVMAGIPGQINHSIIQDAIKRIAKAADKYGKNWGMPVGTPQRAKELMDLGARFICCGNDLLFIKSGLEKMQDDFVKLGFTFDNSLTRARSPLDSP